MRENGFLLYLHRISDGFLSNPGRSAQADIAHFLRPLPTHVVRRLLG